MFLKNQLFSVLILFLLLDFSISAQVGSEKHGVDFVADTAILRSDMQRIMDYGYRNYKNPDVLDSVAYFIKNKLKRSPTALQSRFTMLMAKITGISSPHLMLTRMNG